MSQTKTENKTDNLADKNKDKLKPLMTMTYRIVSHNIGDGQCDYESEEILLNLKEIEIFAKQDKTTFERALIRVISHEEIHKCIWALTNKATTRSFDNYCDVFRKTAKKYLMW